MSLKILLKFISMRVQQTHSIHAIVSTSQTTPNMNIQLSTHRAIIEHHFISTRISHLFEEKSFICVDNKLEKINFLVNEKKCALIMFNFSLPLSISWLNFSMYISVNVRYRYVGNQLMTFFLSVSFYYIFTTTHSLSHLFTHSPPRTTQPFSAN